MVGLDKSILNVGERWWKYLQQMAIGDLGNATSGSLKTLKYIHNNIATLQKYSKVE